MLRRARPDWPRQTAKSPIAATVAIEPAVTIQFPVAAHSASSPNMGTQALQETGLPCFLAAELGGESSLVQAPKG